MISWKALNIHLAAACLVGLAVGSQASAVQLVNLTFDVGNPDDQANHSAIGNILSWTNGSEVFPDVFSPGYMPDDDFGNDYAGLTTPSPRFGWKWGFEGGFDVLSGNWDVTSISFNYAVRGHNGEADMAFQLGDLLVNLPLPSTDPSEFGPNFSPITATGQVATGLVTLDFTAGTTTVAWDQGDDHTAALAQNLSLSQGSIVIDLLTSNTNPRSDGYFDANASSTDAQGAFYQIDNLVIEANEVGDVPAPAAVALMLPVLAGLGLSIRKRT